MRKKERTWELFLYLSCCHNFCMCLYRRLYIQNILGTNLKYFEKPRNIYSHRRSVLYLVTFGTNNIRLIVINVIIGVHHYHWNKCTCFFQVSSLLWQRETNLLFPSGICTRKTGKKSDSFGIFCNLYGKTSLEGNVIIHC